MTARMARSLGQDSFADLTVARPAPPRANSDGTVTFTFPDDVPAETLALIRERMATRDDDELAMRATIRTALAALDALPPLPEVPTDQSRIARLEAQVSALRAVLHPLVCMNLGVTDETT